MPCTDHNRLAATASPYLHQHAENPVHWQPWDAAALAHARDTDTPILLSIGYSACHWCHVMAHECFENPEIAAAMNAAFVNIKLDREERPDIDHVYQLAHQALSGRGGGWPLTAFLDPDDLSPFYIGTYFPPTPRHGLPGFSEVLQRVRGYFDTHREELRAQSGQLRAWLEQVQSGTTDDATVEAKTANRTALDRVTSRFDARFGGSAGAPKFPRPTELEWLLDQGTRGNARAMAHQTIRMMADRGLQDHLGGGFFRYCVDATWTIPHFEKMLYDNAQLLPVFARAAAHPGAEASLRKRAHSAVRGIVDWLARDMAAPTGAFCSSLDADSEGEEGRFYLWTHEQVRAALPASAATTAEALFGLDQPPNFEGRAWHLLRAAPIEDLAVRLGRAPSELEKEREVIRGKLFDARVRRTPPARDDKILTAWNALAVSGLARSARLLDDARCAELARRALGALRETVWIDGELFANAAEPAARIPGFLDDHAFLLDALLECMQLAFDPRDLAWAIALAEALRTKFSERGSGGFWFSAREHATPLARGRSFTDDALPNGNAIAIRSLLRLGHLLGDTNYLGSARYALRAASGALKQLPDACPSLLRALGEFERPRPQIVIRCNAPQRGAWESALRTALRANAIAPGGDPLDAFVIAEGDARLPGLLAERTSRAATGTAWVCTGTTCQAPVTAPDALAGALSGLRAG